MSEYFLLIRLINFSHASRMFLRLASAVRFLEWAVKVNHDHSRLLLFIKSMIRACHIFLFLAAQYVHDHCLHLARIIILRPSFFVVNIDLKLSHMIADIFNPCVE